MAPTTPTGSRRTTRRVLDEPGRRIADRLGAARALYVHLDVSSEEDWAAAVALAVSTFGGVDILINNAGIPGQTTLVETSLEHWQRVVDVRAPNWPWMEPTEPAEPSKVKRTRPGRRGRW